MLWDTELTARAGSGIILIHEQAARAARVPGRKAAKVFAGQRALARENLFSFVRKRRDQGIAPYALAFER